MANITVTSTPVDVNVSTTLGNIVVTDLDSNNKVNVTTTSVNVAVTNNTTNVIVGPGVGVSNTEIRAALSAVFPIEYDQGNGIFSIDEDAIFSGKTTDDLAQGTTNIYFSTSGASVNTTNLPEGTNLYYTQGRFDSAFAGKSTTNLTEGTNLYYTNARVLSAILDGNIKLKQYSETVVDAGTLNGNISLDAAQGTLFYGTINGDITGISLSNFNEGSSLTLVITQDGVGNNNLDTTTYASNWTDWYFVSDENNLNLTAASRSYITLIKVDGAIHAAVVGGEPTLENYVPVNRQIFDNRIVTLAQGPFGGYYANTNLAFGNVYLNTSTGDGSQRFLQSYNNDTGAWTTVDDGAISGVTVVDTGNNEGVVFGRFNPYSATPLSTTRAIIALKGSDTLDLADLTSNSTIRPAISFSTKVDGSTTFNNLKLSLGDEAPTERFGVEDNATLGAARFIGNVIIQNSNLQTNTTFKFGALGNEVFQLDHGTSNAITARAVLSSNSNIITTANIIGAYLYGDGSNLTNVSSVTSVNGQTGVVVLDTGDIPENGNLYYTTDRANAAIDTRVNKAFVDGLGVEYSSLANAPTNVSFFTNDAGYLVAANLASLTANVDSVNGQTGVVVLDTDDIAEGTANLYYTTARANTAIAEKLIDSSQKLIYNAAIQDLYLTPNASSPSGGYYMPNVPGNVGDVLQLTGGDQAEWQRLDTGDVDEGTNLYYTTDRANSAIAAYQGEINTIGNITTTANIVGAYLYGDGSNITGLSGTGTVTQIDTGENLTGGPITSTGTISMANALANVNSVTSEANINLTFNTDDKLILTERINGSTTNTGNINGSGYSLFYDSIDGFYNEPQSLITYSGAGDSSCYVIEAATITQGSNAITSLSVLDNNFDPASVSNVQVNCFPNYFNFYAGESGTYPFPIGTYVTSVDAANSTVYLSNPATQSLTVDINTDNYILQFNTGIFDSSSGTLLWFYSEFDLGVSADKSAIVYTGKLPYGGSYGYPATGIQSLTEFDVSTHTISDYAVDTNFNQTSYLKLAKTQLEAPKTVFNFPRGLTVGEGIDLTLKGTSDATPSFGVNIVWDGLSDVATEYSGTNPQTQILLKQYNDNSAASSARSTAGPRLLLTASEGNADKFFPETYPRENLELGRITWYGVTSVSPLNPDSKPPAWISGLTGQDNVYTNTGVGIYHGNGPDTNSNYKGLYMASKEGNVLIASAANSSGDHQPIIFAPSFTSDSTSNSAYLFNQIVNGNEQYQTGFDADIRVYTNFGVPIEGIDNYQTASGTHFVEINHTDVTNWQGSKLSVTNGNNFASSREGNIVLSLDRNSNTSNVQVQVAYRINPFGTNAYYRGGPSPDRVRFLTPLEGYTNGDPAVFNGFTNATLAAALNGVTVYMSYITFTGIYYEYGLYSDSGLTTPINAIGSNLNGGPAYVEYTRTNSVSAKEWSFNLASGSDNLQIQSDGTTAVTINPSGNIITTANVTATAVETDTININGGNAFLSWNSTDGTVDLAYDNVGVTLQVGQEQHLYCYATENISNGNVVMFVAPTTSSGRINVAKANVSSPGFIDDYIIGVATQDIVSGEMGYVTTFGSVRDVHTTGWSAGDLLWVDPVNVGQLTNVEPATPTRNILVASVQREEVGGGPNGIIFVRLTLGKAYLGKLYDVDITSPQTNDMLVYNGSHWDNSNTIAPANVVLTKFNETVVSLGTLSGDISANLDVSTGSIFQVTTGGALTINSLTNAVAGTSATIIITQGGTTGTLTSSMLFAGASKTLSTNTSDIDIISVFYDGSTYYATLSKGYA